MQRCAITCVALMLLLAGCASKEAYQAHGQYMQAAMQERPMFRMTTQPGEVVTISGVATLELYYPGHEPKPFVDSTAQAWAPVVGGIFSTAIPALGMFGTVYSMGRTMRQMAPYMGDGNMQLNMSGVGGEQDLRILSPDETVSTSTTSTVSP